MMAPLFSRSSPLVAREMVVILDYGSQYTQLIARRVRELHVYAEILPWTASAARVAALKPCGVIFSGGPSSVYAVGAPPLPDYVPALGVPLLGICYGMHLLVRWLGGLVEPGVEREYGPARVQIPEPDVPLFANLPASLAVWMSHGDQIAELPPGFVALARSQNGVLAAAGNPERRIYGLQFHPEVAHTPHGMDILRRFLFDICGCEGTWTADTFIAATVARIREQVGEGGVVCGLSGGVDSAVTAALLHRALGARLTCIFVDTGLLRQN
ncbi:MAG: glutamine-hydrolyzing GMP synthase, partial [Chloroflexota bacterium]|nr:glutamine-hydrolyzing GMP synthase [Chloroflexota bacterium]